MLRPLLFLTVVVLSIGVSLFTFHPSFPHHPIPHKRHHPFRSLTWNSVNIVHTTDTHGWYVGHLNQEVYNANWADFVSFAIHLREMAAENGQDLLLVDSGDRHDGNGLSDITDPNGIVSTPIFIKQDYDLLTIGNHELYLWENSKQEYETIVEHFPDNYVSSNVEYSKNGTYVPFGNRFRYFETPNQKIRTLAFGFLFDFKKFNLGTRVRPIREVVQEKWFRDTLEHHKDKVDLLVIVTHVPIDHKWPELYELNTVLREFFPETVIQYLGGHSHIRDFTVLDSKATALQSGRYCETVGWVSLDPFATGPKVLEINQEEAKKIAKSIFSRSYIDFNYRSFIHHTTRSLSSFDTVLGYQVGKLISQASEDLNLSVPLGTVHQNYFLDYVPLKNPKNIFNLLTNKVLTALKPKSPESAQEERIIIINTGSIRYDLYKGPYTINSQYIVSPFENKWVKLTLPKGVAVRVATTLNEAGYIASSEDEKIDNRKLLPPHQQSILQHGWHKGHRKYHGQDITHNNEDQNVFKISPTEKLYHIQKSEELSEVAASKLKTKLSKGYVTHDDFGNDGDDTIHKPTVNFPLTNVVASTQVHETSGPESPVDLVFYDFITPNILWALNQLGYEGETQVTSYSDVYLGVLLTEYIQKHEV